MLDHLLTLSYLLHKFNVPDKPISDHVSDGQQEVIKRRGRQTDLYIPVGLISGVKSRWDHRIITVDRFKICCPTFSFTDTTEDHWKDSLSTMYDRQGRKGQGVGWQILHLYYWPRRRNWDFLSRYRIPTFHLSGFHRTRGSRNTSCRCRGSDSTDGDPKMSSLIIMTQEQIR